MLDGITHVIRGDDHVSNTPTQINILRALGADLPVYAHIPSVLGPDGKKLAKREPGATVASLREAGIPAEAVRAYLEELGLPRHDVHYDLRRIKRLSVEAIEAMSDEELAERAGVPVAAAVVMRGARDLVEARAFADLVLNAPEDVPLPAAKETLARFRELARDGLDAKGIVRELKAVGGDLRSLRLALTGKERGPELWAVIAALPREEALRRAERALGPAT